MVFKKKLLFYLLVFSFSFAFSQVDYSNRWEDFFSYNKVRNFLVQDDTLYALTENAVFVYDLQTESIRKISSVNGLSGDNTSAIYFDASSNRLVIGYDTGLLEIVESDGSVRVSADIINFNQSGAKAINHISRAGDILYLSLPFGIVEYNITRLEFGDTFFIGNNSQALVVNETLVDGDDIYAATADGVYRASLNSPNLIDFNNWVRITQGNFTQVDKLGNAVYVASNNALFRVGTSGVSQVRSFGSTINSVDASGNNLLVSESNRLNVLAANLNTTAVVSNTNEFSFTVNQSLMSNNQLFLATNEFGVLETTLANTAQFKEIHPIGPLRNDIFSLSASNNNLWVVYGGYSAVFAPLKTNMGYSHFDGTDWNNVRYDPSNPLPDLVDVTFDPSNANKVYISGFGDTNDINTRKTGGLLVVEDGVETNFFNQANSGLQDIVPSDPNRVTIRVSGSAFDNQGNLWMTNIGVPNELVKFANGSWTSFDISAGKPGNSFGLRGITVDRANNVWIATRSDGAVVFNENGNRVRGLNTNATQGSLPNASVRTIAADDNNRIWIGTNAGLVVFNNANNVFNANIIDAEPVVILENGVPRRLLGDQAVTSIVVDGANNKWFGSGNGGVIYTNPNGQTTLGTFNKENSPLPSNRIVKIAVDKSNGKVYFATDRGVVAYDSNVSPFGNELGEVYAYPNPALRRHQNVTIDGRNGTNLPRGTNVKILDVAGNLVFETNVIEGQQVNGGKVVWNKKNLAGKSVASGVYIVLLSNDDASQTSVTKIAIIN